MNEEIKVVISVEIGDLKKNIKDAKDKVKGFSEEGKQKFSEFNDAFQKVGNVSKGVLAAMGGAIVGAKAALLALAGSTQEYRNQQAQLITAFETAGGSAETAKETYNDLFRVLGDSGKATEASQHLGKLTTEEKALAEWTEICQGVYATFGDSLAIEGLAEAVNHTAKLGEVQGTLADALEWSGTNIDAFNEQLATCNTEAEREKLIREALNGMYSEAAANYEVNNAAILAQNEAQAQLNEAMAALGEVAQPIMTMLTQLGAEILTQLTPYIQEFAEKYLPDIKEALSGVGEAVGKVITWIADNWELVSTLAAIIAGIAAALTVFSTVMGIVNAVMAASPVTWIVLGIVAAIAALVAIIVVVIKHWDEIKEATKKCWDAIVDAVKIAIDWVVDFFNKMIDWVKQNWQGLLLLLVNPFAGAFKLLYDNCDGFREFIDKFVEKVKELVQKGFELAKQYIIEPIKNAIQSVKDKFEEMKNAISEKIENIKSKVTDVFTSIKTNISNKITEAKNTVTSIFDSIKSKITSTIEGARDKVKSAIDKIKGFFNFKWELPKLKLPHFKISGKFSLDPPSIPKFSVDWYARGGVFDSPTLFGYGNGRVGGLGEAGAEAIVPLEKNTQWLDRIAERLAGSGQPIVLKVGEKVFGEIACSSINSLTRQTGTLPLVLA